MRDSLTVALDSTFVTWGWFLYSFSPAVPLLAAELGVSRAVAGLHGTAMAVGTVATGLVSERAARALGRKRQLLAGLAITAVGVVLLVVGPGLAATLTACLVAAVGGNLALAATQTAMLAHHGPAGPAAVTEGNGYGTAVGLLAPLVLGATVAAAAGLATGRGDHDRRRGRRHGAGRSPARRPVRWGCPAHRPHRAPRAARADLPDPAWSP